MKKLFEKQPGIYIITNIINNKKYVGSSKNICSRISSHKSLLKKNKHGNQYLQNAYNKYKKDNFIFKVLEYCTEDSLLLLEDKYINLYKSDNKLYGYNIESFLNGRKLHSEESKLKIGLSNKGKRKNYIPSQEQIEQFKEMAKQPKSDIHKANIAKAHLGKNREPFSQEWKDKMGISRSSRVNVHSIYNELLYSNITVSELSKLWNITNSSLLNSKNKGYIVKKQFILTNSSN